MTRTPQRDALLVRPERDSGGETLMATSTHGVTHWTPESCFGCKIKTVATAYGSVNGVLQGSAGRNAFHGEHRDGGTIRERRSHMIEEARSKGVEPIELTRREKSQYDSGEKIG